MPATPHVEGHFSGSENVRDVVIGMADGLTVPFALAAGLSSGSAWADALRLRTDIVVDGEFVRWADLPAKEQNKFIKNLCAQEFDVKGKTTFKEEFVTSGGIQLSEIDYNTMQSKKIPGLFFAGEVINVDGVTGGFNFQNAWTTGWIAAKAVSSLEV